MSLNKHGSQRFRVIAAGRETVANLGAHALLSALLALIAAGVGFGVTTVITAETASFENEARALDDRGRNVVVVTGRLGISAERCAEIAWTPGVLRSGALLRSEPATLRTTATRSATVRTVTRGYADIVWPSHPKSDGLLVGPKLADELQVSGQARAWVHVADDEISLMKIGVVQTASARDADANRSAFRLATAHGVARECLIESEPGAGPGVIALAQQMFAEDDPIVAPVYAPDATVALPEARFQERTTDILLPVATSLIFAIALLGLWLIRGKDFALYRLLALPPPLLAGGLLLEAALLVAIPYAAGTAAGIATSSWISTLSLALVAFASVKVLATIAFVPLVGYWMLSAQRPTSVLRR